MPDPESENPPLPPAADQPQLKAATDEAGGEAEMPFLDHLEELRWRILKALIAVLIGAIVSFVFAKDILTLLTHPYEDAVRSTIASQSAGPAEAILKLIREWRGVDAAVAEPGPSAAPMPVGRQLQSIKVMTYFFVTLQVALLGGFVLAMPVVFYQFWQFVAPGLLSREKRLLVPIAALSVICFSLGAMVAYHIVLPIGLRFFLSLEPPDMTSQWAVNEYMGFVLRLIFGFGIVFEMPVVTLFLGQIGLVTPAHMRRVRRYAVVAIFVTAAVFTPPDPVSQLLMALPLLGLYEISIWVCGLAQRKR